MHASVQKHQFFLREGFPELFKLGYYSSCFIRLNVLLSYFV
jgi:hypothetical protein